MSAPSARRTRRPRLRLRTDLGLTRRALVLVGVLLVLGLSYANSLRIMLNQQQEIDATRRLVAERTAQVGDLEAQLRRWQDPAYIKNQARAQLGWVVKGEVGYRVIDADGTVLTTQGASSGVATKGPAEAPNRWWERMAESIAAADKPPSPAPR